jgi:hypothetical protein
MTMSTLIRRGALAAIPMLIFATACSDSGPLDIDDEQINADVALMVADATGDDIALMTDEADDTMRPGFGGQDCPRQGFRFRCGPRGFFDLQLSREVTFFDEFDVEQGAFDPIATDKIHVVFDMTGSRNLTEATMEVVRHRDFWVTGLKDEESQRTWDGEGSSDVSRIRFLEGAAQRSYDMSSTTTVTAVVVPVPRDWPLSGTIERTMTVEIVDELGNSRTVTRSTTVTFNGTQFATLEVGDDEFSIDLGDRTAGPRKVGP